MDTDMHRLDALARAIGDNPLVTLGLLAVVVAALLLALVTLVRFVVRHRREAGRAVTELWRRGTALPPVRAVAARVPWMHGAVRHVSGRAFLAIYLVVGLVLSVGVLGFLRLAEQVAGEAAITRFDVALAEALHAGATPEGVQAFIAVTALGSGYALTVLAAVVALILLRRGQRVLALGWIVAVAGGAILNALLKVWYQRPRPSFADPFVYHSSWSFPSGHSMGTFIACGMLVYLALFAARSTVARLTIIVAAVVWTLVIGFSRMYLGVHYFSDVIGGYVAGSVWVGACITGIELVRRRRRGREVVTEPAEA